MTLTLVATPKATNANTYATRAQSDTYHESVLRATAWTGASTGDQDIALVMATRLMDDLMDWNGSPTTDTQALRAPRVLWYTPDGVEQDKDTIPQWLINATSELARHLLASDIIARPQGEGFKRFKAGPLEGERDLSDVPMVFPPSVWSMVRHYGQLRDPKGHASRVRLAR